MFQGISQFANLLKNAQQLQGRAQDMRERLAALRAEGSSGGGMVKVQSTGDMKITSLTIEPSLLQSGDKELLEELILSATNQALSNARDLASQELSSLAAGLGIPGLNEAVSRFGFGP